MLLPGGASGSPGELWFVRLYPPIDPAGYHVAITTPYILMGFGKADWTAYLSKSLVGLTAPEKRRRLHEALKYGRGSNFWSEFIFKAYHHRPDAIFLTGLPDVPRSMPHAKPVIRPGDMACLEPGGDESERSIEASPGE